MITCTFDDGGIGNLRHVCVDALLIQNNTILLGKRSLKLSTAPGKYCIPGGYLDRDESTIQGIIREVHEETGYIVRKGTLFHIRDYPDDLEDHNRQNIAFTYLFTDPILDSNGKLDWDSDKPSWISLNKVDQIKNEIAFDHWHIIKAYLQHLKQPTTLPVWNACVNYTK